MVQKFLWAGGWHVYTCTTSQVQDVANIVASGWFGVMRFSLSAQFHHEKLMQAAAPVREASLNRQVGVIVSGPAFSGHPERVAQV